MSSASLFHFLGGLAANSSHILPFPEYSTWRTKNTLARRVHHFSEASYSQWLAVRVDKRPIPLPQIRGQLLGAFCAPETPMDYTKARLYIKLSPGSSSFLSLSYCPYSLTGFFLKTNPSVNHMYINPRSDLTSKKPNLRQLANRNGLGKKIKVWCWIILGMVGNEDSHYQSCVEHWSSMMCGDNAIAKTFTRDELEQVTGRKGGTTSFGVSGIWAVREWGEI